MVMKIATALLLAAPLTWAGDFVKQLTPRDFKSGGQVTLDADRLPDHRATITCAIPLKEIHAGNARRIDPMERPHPYRDIDKGIEHPVPIRICRNK
jgi:hypothetical protein